MKSCSWVSALALATSLCAAGADAADATPPTAVAGPYKDLEWDQLVPEDWDPMKRFRNLNLGALNDSNPVAQSLLREMRESWNNAPTNNKLDGAAVRLPGYVVPLDEVKGELKEFLLVPYFGACIHTPPPPANQVVHVIAAVPAKGFRMMDAVWVSGTLNTVRQDSAMGMSGYRLKAASVAAYVAPKRP